MVEDRDDNDDNDEIEESNEADRLDDGVPRFEGRADRLVQVGKVYGGVNISPSPPEKSMPAPHQIGLRVRSYTNNKAQLSGLIQRITPAEQEGEPRLAIVCGGPGSGRSALVTEVAHVLSDDFPDGIFHVSLGARDDELLRVRLAEMLFAVGYSIEAIPASLEGRAGVWRTWSKGKRVLLIADHAITAAQVQALMPGPGRSSIVVIRSGTVSGLASKDAEVNMEPMSDASARVLLGKLAPKVDLEADQEAVDNLLRHCEGWVIALKAVGVLLEDMAPTKLAGKLNKSGRMLRTLSPHDGVALRPVLGAAYERLDGNDLARACYRLLGAHPHDAGVTAEAVGAILADDGVDEIDEDDAESALMALVRVGLAVESSPERWQIASPNLVGPHAAELLEEAGDGGAVRRRILAYYLSRTLACSQAWMPDRIWLKEIWDVLPEPEPDREAAKVWLRAERTNLRAMVELAYALGELDSACQMAIALWPLHDQDKHTNEMISVCNLAASAADVIAAPLAASLVRQQLAFGYRERRDFDQAAKVLRAAMQNAEDAGSELAYYSAMEACGLVLRDQDESEQALRLLKENYEFAQRSDDPRRAALAAFHYGTVSRDMEEMESLFDSAAAQLSREPYNLAKIALWRGRRMIDFGRQAEANEALAEAAERAKTGGWHHERVRACRALADLARARRDVEAERLHLTTGLEISQVRGLGAERDEIIDRLEEMPPLPQRPSRPPAAN